MSARKLLKFKSRPELPQMLDSTGFMWLDGHEKETNIWETLTKKFPKNFEIIEKPVKKEVNKSDENVNLEVDKEKEDAKPKVNKPKRGRSKK